MTIRYSPAFIKNLKTLNIRIRKSFTQQILIFAQHPHDLQLNNHLLQDKWEGYRSINITADYRVIYEEVKEGEEIIAYFVAIGTHRQLYRA